MINVPLTEILDIWSELDDCYHGKNGYGGDICEIYAYRFWRDMPSIRELPRRSDIRQKAEKEREQIAKASLLAILSLFREKRRCAIFIDGLPMYCERFDFSHRVHVRVVPEG